MYISCDFTDIACVVSEIVSSIVDVHSGYDGWWRWYSNGEHKGNGHTLQLSLPSQLLWMTLLA